MRHAGVPAAFSFLVPASARLQVFSVSLGSRAPAAARRVRAIVFTAILGSIYQEERRRQETQHVRLMAEEVQAGNRRVSKSIIKMHGK